MDWGKIYAVLFPGASFFVFCYFFSCFVCCGGDGKLTAICCRGVEGLWAQELEQYGHKMAG